MTDTIKIVELPVGAGKTYQIIKQIEQMSGDVIYSAPTITLCKQIQEEISNRVASKECFLVTSNEIGVGQRVGEYFSEVLNSTDDDKCIICTHEGLAFTDVGIFQDYKVRKGDGLTIIIDELPGLFKSYSRKFTDDLKNQLETIISVDDGKVEVFNEGLYRQVIEGNFYHPDTSQLLKLRNSVRMIHDQEDEVWSFFGYELADSFREVLELADEVYLLASTITGTLDETILKDIWNFELEKAEEIYARIDQHDLIDRAKRAHIIPLLDSSYSKGKALDKNYAAKSGKCLNTMINTAIGLIQDNEAIMVVNKWAIPAVREHLEYISNIEMLRPNVKGMNTHQAKHWCCALYTAKRTHDIHKSLKLLADTHKLDHSSLIEAYELQYDLDMIVQMCGRISIRDRNASSKCTFIVPDRLSAQHLVKVLTGNIEHYDELVDESHMLCWDDMTEGNTTIGRPPSEEKKLRLAQLELIILEEKASGDKPKKAKVLATMFNVKPAQISKDLKYLRESNRL